MTVPLYLVLPLTSAIAYVVAALLLKRASDLGADVWQTTRMVNYTTAVVSMPLWVLGGTLPSVGQWWQPAVGGVLFLAGQVFTLLALRTGDVSVATPVLGLKVLFVAVMTTVLIGDAIGARLWTAAVLSSVAIALLNMDAGVSAHVHRRASITILLAALGAAAYASLDVVTQKWALQWGPGRFVPMAMLCGAIYSPALRRFDSRRASSEQLPLPYMPWVLAGAVCLAVQGVMFIVSIVLYRQAVSANVLYSSRGLWSVIAVWAVGHWFANREQHLGPRVLAWRFAGAILMMAALLMVVTSPAPH